MGHTCQYHAHTNTHWCYVCYLHNSAWRLWMMCMQPVTLPSSPFPSLATKCPSVTGRLLTTTAGLLPRVWLASKRLSIASPISGQYFLERVWDTVVCWTNWCLHWYWNTLTVRYILVNWLIGFALDWDEILYEGSPEELKFAAFFVKWAHSENTVGRLLSMVVNFTSMQEIIMILLRKAQFLDKIKFFSQFHQKSWNLQP